ncbi:hypothetical protein HMPREF9602_00019 [Cutibacterium acnes HL030PA2]|nr:hypothetical protein HMPREF9602_00019 [Cutibacterium acnes HL030PA2]
MSAYSLNPKPSNSGPRQRAPSTPTRPRQGTSALRRPLRQSRSPPASQAVPPRIGCSG